MTALPVGARLSVGQTRRARREVAANHVEGALAAGSVRVPRLVIILGLALLALTLLDVALTVVQLV